MTLFESIFILDEKYYKQCNGVAAGSLLGLTLTVFMKYNEKIWLKNCQTQIKPVVYRRYVDDTFLLFGSTEHVSEIEKNSSVISRY